MSQTSTAVFIDALVKAIAWMCCWNSFPLWTSFLHFVVSWCLFPPLTETAVDVEQEQYSMIMLLSHQRINNHIQYGPNNMQMAFLARLHIVKYNFGLIYSIICVTLYYLHQIFLPSGDSKKIALFSILFSQQPYEVDLAKGGGVTGSVSLTMVELFFKTRLLRS